MQTAMWGSSPSVIPQKLPLDQLKTQELRDLRGVIRHASGVILDHLLEAISTQKWTLASLPIQ